MRKQIIYLLSFLLLIYSCQKEISFETGGEGDGTLQADAGGDCLPKTVNGAYIATTPLVATTNTITVDVNVTTTGTYTIYTDTVNGYFFNGMGTFTSLGMNTITLRGSGTPFAAGVNNFIVHFKTSTCDIQVTVLPAGTGAAVFTLAGSPNACTGAIVNGSYAVGTALNATNTATISVNVTTIGTYSIATTATNGMTFSRAGAFAAPGVQTVTLNGTGTPVTAGSTTIPVTAGASNCTFTVTVGNNAVGTLGGGPAPGACTPATVNGTYTVGTALVGANNVQVQVNVTTPGVYNITTNTNAGISFSATGTFAATGTQNVTLNGTGNPTTAGNQTYTVTFGGSTCTFVVNIGAGTGATGTLGGAPNACTPATVNGTYVVGTALTGTNNVIIQVNVTAPGSYNITTNTVTGFSFAATGNFAATGVQTVTLSGTGNPTTAGNQTFTVTFGTSTCTFVVNVTAAATIDYFPRTTNSNWSYEFDDVANDSLLMYVIAPTITAGGNPYNIFMMNDGSGPDSLGYFRKSGNDYFRWANLAYYLGLDNDQWVAFNFIKDNSPAGTVWNSASYTNSVNSNPIMVRFKFTILQKDVSISIPASTGTISYPNTIVVKEEYEVYNGTSWDLVPFYFIDYYSRGVGWILDEYFDGTTGTTPTSIQELRRKVVL